MLRLDLRKLTYIYILTFPFFGFSLVNWGNRGLLRPDWLVGGLLLLLFSLESLAGRLRIPVTLINLTMGLYLVSGLVSGVSVLGASSVGPFVDFTTKGLQLLLVTPVFFVIASLPAQRRMVENILRTWVMSGFLVSLHAIYQLFAQIFELPFASFTLTNPTVSGGVQSTRTIFGYTQPTSVFQEPSYMGAFLGPCLLLITIFVLEQRAENVFFRRRLLNWFVMITIALAVFLSNSQAILISVLFTLLWGFSWKIFRRTRLIKLLLTIVGGLVAVGMALRSFGIDFFSVFLFRMQYLLINIMDPTNSPEVTSFANRWERMSAGIDVWRTHPLFGVGLGNMGYHTNVHDWSNSPWVQLLVEQGIVGTALLALVFGLLFYNLYHALRHLSTDRYWRPLLIAMISVVVLTAVDGFFTLNWTHPQRIFTLAFANWVAQQAQYRLVTEYSQLRRGRPQMMATTIVEGQS